MAKRQTKNKRTSKKYEKYKLAGDKLERSPVCPKCGPSYFLADHKDRLFCGRCHYSEINAKKN